MEWNRIWIEWINCCWRTWRKNRVRKTKNIKVCLGFWTFWINIKVFRWDNYGGLDKLKLRKWGLFGLQYTLFFPIFILNFFLFLKFHKMYLFLWVSVFMLFELLCKFSIFKEISNECSNNKIYCKVRNGQKVKPFKDSFNGERLTERELFWWWIFVGIHLLKLVEFS